MDGYIYCLSNNMYGDSVYKLGRTKNINKRLNAYTTSYIEPVILEKLIKVIDDDRAEHILFDILREYRIKQNREFFKNEDKNLIFDAMETAADIVNNNKPYECTPRSKFLTEEQEQKQQEIKLKILNELKIQFDNEMTKDAYEKLINNFTTSKFWKNINRDEFIKVMNIQDKQKYKLFSDTDKINFFNKKFNNLFKCERNMTPYYKFIETETPEKTTYFF